MLAFNHVEIENAVAWHESNIPIPTRRTQAKSTGNRAVLPAIERCPVETEALGMGKGLDEVAAPGGRADEGAETYQADALLAVTV